VNFVAFTSISRKTAPSTFSHRSRRVFANAFAHFCRVPPFPRTLLPVPSSLLSFRGRRAQTSFQFFAARRAKSPETIFDDFCAQRRISIVAASETHRIKRAVVRISIQRERHGDEHIYRELRVPPCASKTRSF